MTLESTTSAAIMCRLSGHGVPHDRSQVEIPVAHLSFETDIHFSIIHCPR